MSEFEAVELAATRLQVLLDQDGIACMISKPESWREIGIDVRLNDDRMLRLLPRGDAVRLLLYRLPEQTSVTAATISPDADYDEIAELAKTMLTGD